MSDMDHVGAQAIMHECVFSTNRLINLYHKVGIAAQESQTRICITQFSKPSGMPALFQSFLKPSCRRSPLRRPIYNWLKFLLDPQITHVIIVFWACNKISSFAVLL